MGLDVYGRTEGWSVVQLSALFLHCMTALSSNLYHDRLEPVKSHHIQTDIWISCLFGHSLGAPVSSHSRKICRLGETDHLNCLNLSVNGCLSIRVWIWFQVVKIFRSSKLRGWWISHRIFCLSLPDFIKCYQNFHLVYMCQSCKRLGVTQYSHATLQRISVYR